MGLYDANMMQGPVQLDVGKEDESYQGISRDHIRAAGKLILRDSLGIFGNPTADSRRTSVTSESRSILIIFFTPPEIREAYLKETLEYLEGLISTECGGCVVRRYQLVF